MNKQSELSGPRFFVLDGLRGLAALAVVLLHTFRHRGNPLPNAHLAVDLFFILSGFVIAHSYEPKLDSGMRAAEFLQRRFIRLYPMLFVGAFGGLLIALINHHNNPTATDPLPTILFSGGLSLLVLPYLGQGVSPGVFSYDPPLWSLFFEIWVNIAYVTFRRRLSTPVLVSLILASLTTIAVRGPLGGFHTLNLVYGIPRVVAGFFGGVLLFRLWSADRLPALRASPYVLGAVVLAVFAVRHVTDGLAYAPTFFVLLLVVLGGANARPSRADRLFARMGEISYPVYVVHWLTLHEAIAIGGKLGLLQRHYVILGLAHFAVIPIIGLALFRFYETPTMLALKRALPRWRSRAEVIEPA